MNSDALQALVTEAVHLRNDGWSQNAIRDHIRAKSNTDTALMVINSAKQSKLYRDKVRDYPPRSVQALDPLDPGEVDTYERDSRASGKETCAEHLEDLKLEGLRCSPPRDWWSGGAKVVNADVGLADRRPLTRTLSQISYCGSAAQMCLE